MNKVKEKIIHWLGGYTPTDLTKEKKSVPPSIKTIGSSIESYNIAETALWADKKQLARNIGRRMLDEGLIDFEIEQKKDEICMKIYKIKASVCVLSNSSST